MGAAAIRLAAARAATPIRSTVTLSWLVRWWCYLMAIVGAQATSRSNHNHTEALAAKASVDSTIAAVVGACRVA